MDNSLLNCRFGRLMVVSRHDNTNTGQKRWICKCDCGVMTLPIRTNSLKSGNTRSCGCLQKERSRELGKRRTGDEHPNWRGGRHVDEHGYVKIRVNGKYRPEHHLVMEQRLNRTLLPDETVHHKNGVRDDNRDDNLELWCSRHPAGQRVEDLLVWADDIIGRYRK